MKLKCIIISVCMIILLQIIVVLSCFPFLGTFLAKHRPLNGEVLVVEGWIPVYLFEDVKKIIDSGNYGKVICVGNCVPHDDKIDKSNSSAECSAYYLRALGVPDSLVKVLVTPFVSKDRTYNSAVEAIKWLNTEYKDVLTIDVVTSSVHSRRSWILFKKAAEKKFKIGIISLKPQSFTLKKWWSNSQGFRTVINEFLAYIYVKLIFKP